jgi:hypothetical protein
MLCEMRVVTMNSRSEEHRQETPHHQVVDLLLGLGQAARRPAASDDRKVVADLGVVEDRLLA